MRRKQWNLAWIVFLVGILVAGGWPATAAAGFTNNNDGTATDGSTDLMWQREDDNTTRTWANALKYCEQDLELPAGNSSNDDWRLPNVRELLTITDVSLAAIVDPNDFPNTNQNRYWTSTPFKGDTAKAWYVDFATGYAQEAAVSGTSYVRCVRGGKAEKN